MYVAKTKALISFAVTAKLICVFVFAYMQNPVFSCRGSYVPCFTGSVNEFGSSTGLRRLETKLASRINESDRQNVQLQLMCRMMYYRVGE